jgi:hypothetical protein
MYDGLGNRCSPENRGKLKDAIFRLEKIDYGEEFGDSAHRWNSYLGNSHSNPRLLIGPPSTSAQNWRVVGVDNTGASGLWSELVK